MFSLKQKINPFESFDTCKDRLIDRDRQKYQIYIDRQINRQIENHKFLKVMITCKFSFIPMIEKCWSNSANKVSKYMNIFYIVY